MKYLLLVRHNEDGFKKIPKVTRRNMLRNRFTSATNLIATDSMSMPPRCSLRQQGPSFEYGTASRW
jgi:hypothetical protein